MSDKTSNKTSDKRLLPCPFCGAELELEEKGEFYIHPSSNCYMNLNAVKNNETRIKAWNTRKPMDRIVERLETDYSQDVGFLKMISVDKAIEIVKEEGGLIETGI